MSRITELFNLIVRTLKEYDPETQDYITAGCKWIVITKATREALELLEGGTL